MQELAGRSELIALFEEIVSQAEETVVITNGSVDTDDGPIIEYINAAAEQRTGYAREALIGAPLRRLVLPELWPDVHGQLCKVCETRQAAQIELRAKDTRGKEYWMELSTVPIFGAHGEIQHFVRTGRDITARKQAEQQREMTQRLLASVFGVMESPLVVTNEAGAVIMVNGALGRRLGWGVFDTIGQPFTALFPDADRSMIDAELKAGGLTDHQRRIAVNLLHRDGRVFAGVANITAVKSPTLQDVFLIRLQMNGESASMPGPEASLREIVDQNAASTQLVAGKLQLVGMAELRDQLGARWAELQEQAFGIAHDVIRRHLRAGDVCKRSANEGFLVLFQDLVEADAQKKAFIIGEEIRDRLFTEVPEMSTAKVSSFATNVSVRATDADSEEKLLGVLSSRLEKERQQIERTAHETIKAELRTARAVMQQAQSTDGQQVPVLMTRLPGRLRASLETVRSLGQDAYAVDVDMFLLAGAGQHALSTMGQGKSSLILVPLKFSTASRQREFDTWLKGARALGDAGKSQIVVEITDIPRTVLRAKLAEIAMPLAPLFRATAFELASADPTFAAGLPMATRLATISIGQLLDRGAVSSEAASRLVKVLEARQCKLIAKGCAASTHAPGLAAGGIQLLFADAPAGET